MVTVFIVVNMIMFAIASISHASKEEFGIATVSLLMGLWSVLVLVIHLGWLHGG